MSDVKMEYEQAISRNEAAAWLSQLALAFSGDHDAEIPFGPGTVKLHVPGSVRAQLEVEVGDDEVEIEIEFTWPLSQRTAGTAAAARAARPVSAAPELVNGAGQRAHAGRAKRK